MRKDVVCGMDVDEKDSVKDVHGGLEYFFCSESCRDTFKKNPEKFV